MKPSIATAKRRRRCRLAQGMNPPVGGPKFRRWQRQARGLILRGFCAILRAGPLTVQRLPCQAQFLQT